MSRKLPIPTSVPTAPELLRTLLAAMFVLVGVVSSGAEAGAAASGGGASVALPVLPVVARPEPAKPVVGVPSDAHLDRTPPRHTKGLDLVTLGWSYNCMECHKLLPARWHYDRPMVEHGNIRLEHGENRFCLNCHHATNRNAFVDYDGAEIREADVFLLCAKCHGPTYRDWKAGVHGRRNGFWDPRKGTQTRLRCIECHDPHSPKLQPLTPLAPLRYPARLHRQLHLPGRRRGGRGHARHPGLRLQEGPHARGGALRRAHGHRGHRHVPALRHRGPRPPGAVSSHDPALREVQLAGLDPVLGRDRAERVSAAEPAHRGLSAVLPVSSAAAAP